MHKMLWAIAQEVRPSTHKFVLFYLAYRCGDDRGCWPSYGDIAFACGISKQTAITAIKALSGEAGGLPYITVDESYTWKGRRTSNVYDCNVMIGDPITNLRFGVGDGRNPPPGDLPATYMAKVVHDPVSVGPQGTPRGKAVRPLNRSYIKSRSRKPKEQAVDKSGQGSNGLTPGGQAVGPESSKEQDLLTSDTTEKELDGIDPIGPPRKDATSRRYIRVFLAMAKRFGVEPAMNMIEARKRAWLSVLKGMPAAQFETAINLSTGKDRAAPPTAEEFRDTFARANARAADPTAEVK